MKRDTENSAKQIEICRSIQKTRETLSTNPRILNLLLVMIAGSFKASFSYKLITGGAMALSHAHNFYCEKNSLRTFTGHFDLNKFSLTKPLTLKARIDPNAKGFINGHYILAYPESSTQAGAEDHPLRCIRFRVDQTNSFAFFTMLVQEKKNLKGIKDCEVTGFLTAKILSSIQILVFVTKLSLKVA